MTNLFCEKLHQEKFLKGAPGKVDQQFNRIGDEYESPQMPIDLLMVVFKFSLLASLFNEMLRFLNFFFVQSTCWVSTNGQQCVRSTSKWFDYEVGKIHKQGFSDIEIQPGDIKAQSDRWLSSEKSVH